MHWDEVCSHLCKIAGLPSWTVSLKMVSIIGKGLMVPCAVFQSGLKELYWAPWVCLHHRVRAIRGELCSCACGGNTAEHSVSWGNTRHCCWPLQSVNLGKGKHVGGWKVTLGSDLRTDWARSCLWIFLPLVCQQRSALASSSSLLSLHQPFMVKRLKRLGNPSSLARLFYLPVTLLLFWLFSPGVPAVGRRQMAPRAGQATSCHCSGHLVEEGKAERRKIYVWICSWIYGLS